ncbi:hypothetical protein KP509_21G071900 [Ceratopteris richardii]|nr:hypothetical protein KP509_21G071900 [Ceratopteris richardii]KAH7315947.1 hypothetical protein KP509_21G071900 [Ceratopteris richardii]KAH7315948.1 hypothetical protein KP509_21G071900 [Ceratopteris richardii]
MAERLVRSQEEAFTEKFEHYEVYLQSLKQNNLITFKNLHQQVMTMRKQDSHAAYQLKLAERSYQALMSLAVKIQETGLDKVRMNLLKMKASMEGVINDLASKMCQPLVVFLKGLKEDNNALTAVLKLQALLAEMNGRFSSMHQNLSAANKEYKVCLEKKDLQLQACNKEVEKLSVDGETLRSSLMLKEKEVEALKMVLAGEIEEKQSYKVQLDCVNERICRLEDELRQKEIKLSNAVKLFESIKVQISHQNLQVADVLTKSKEVCNQLSAVKNTLNETCIGVQSYVDDSSNVHYEALKCVLQPSFEEQLVCFKTSSMDEDKPQALSDGISENLCSDPQVESLKEANNLFTTSGRQETNEALREVTTRAYALSVRASENTTNTGSIKEEIPSSELFPEHEKNFLIWLSNFRYTQSLIEHLQVIQACSKAMHDDVSPTHSSNNFAICSNCSKEFSSSLCEPHLDLPGLSKAPRVTFQSVAALMVSMFSHSKNANYQSSKVGHNGSNYDLRQGQEIQMRDVHQHENEAAQHKQEISWLSKIDRVSGSANPKEKLYRRKSNTHDDFCSDQRIESVEMPPTAKKVCTGKDVVSDQPPLQFQSEQPPSPASAHELMDDWKFSSSIVITESPKEMESLLSSQRVDQSTVLSAESGERKLIHSSKELWQVLELATDTHCIERKEGPYIGEDTSLEHCLNIESEHHSEPSLFIKDDVQQNLIRPLKRRVSSRLQGRSIIGSPPYRSWK